MKRIGKIEIITLVFMVASLAGSAGAEITWSGNVDPSNPSTWNSSTTGIIGQTGSGSMSINGGSDLTDYRCFVGYSYNGSVSVDGVGSTWTNTNGLEVGVFNNSGTLDITGGGQVNNDNCYIASDGGTGEITVDGFGSRLTNSGELLVGSASVGTLNLTNGGKAFSDSGIIGWWSSSTGTAIVDGTGSKWINSGNLMVGDRGRGTLEIVDGGHVRIAGTLTIDNDGDEDNFVNMSAWGELALFGDGSDSIIDFLGLVNGSDAIRYWNGSNWANIAGGTYGIDYTLEYITAGNLTGYTMLTVPEPATMILLGLGGLMLRKRKA